MKKCQMHHVDKNGDRSWEKELQAGSQAVTEIPRIKNLTVRVLCANLTMASSYFTLIFPAVEFLAFNIFKIHFYKPI